MSLEKSGHVESISERLQPLNVEKKGGMEIFEMLVGGDCEDVEPNLERVERFGTDLSGQLVLPQVYRDPELKQYVDTILNNLRYKLPLLAYGVEDVVDHARNGRLRVNSRKFADKYAENIRNSSFFDVAAFAKHLQVVNRISHSPLSVLTFLYSILGSYGMGQIGANSLEHSDVHMKNVIARGFGVVQKKGAQYFGDHDELATPSEAEEDVLRHLSGGIGNVDQIDHHSVESFVNNDSVRTFIERLCENFDVLLEALEGFLFKGVANSEFTDNGSDVHLGEYMQTGDHNYEIIGMKEYAHFSHKLKAVFDELARMHVNFSEIPLFALHKTESRSGLDKRVSATNNTFKSVTRAIGHIQFEIKQLELGTEISDDNLEGLDKFESALKNGQVGYGLLYGLLAGRVLSILHVLSIEDSAFDELYKSVNGKGAAITQYPNLLNKTGFQLKQQYSYLLNLYKILKSFTAGIRLLTTGELK